MTRGGFTLIELILAVAIIAILGAIAVPTYLGWRADAINREVVAQVESALSDARQDAKRLATDVAVVFTDGASTYTVGGEVRSLPNGAVIGTSGGTESVTFRSVLGVQAPFSVVQVDLSTGAGALARTATISIVPPLAKTSVVRP